MREFFPSLHTVVDLNIYFIYTFFSFFPFHSTYLCGIDFSFQLEAFRFRFSFSIDKLSVMFHVALLLTAIFLKVHSGVNDLLMNQLFGPGLLAHFFVVCGRGEL